tara:strand:- start:5303 stop:6877 length:1575 start_codon:yes stop_codon:yes gene_type:complete
MIDQNKKNIKNSIAKSSFIVGGMTFISRISGFMRDILFANIFGASSSTDAFFISFKIPNFFRRLFAEGAFIQSFVPILNEYKTTKPSEVKKLICYVQGNLALILFFITFLGIIFSEEIINIFAPGFDSTDSRYYLASDMLKITFPYLFFISLTAMYAGIFNTYDKFFLPSITPVLLNVSLISAAIYSTGMSYTPIIALAYGVLFAGLIQYSIQLPFLYKMNLLVIPKVNFRYSGVNKVLKLMLPAILGTAVVQINLIVDSIVASMLAPGSISWLYYSDRLVEFPLGVFGIAIATVILPILSAKYSSKDLISYKKTLSNALRIVLIFSLPATFGLILLSEHIIISLFQYGSFMYNDTYMSSLSLVAYSLGLPAFIIMKVLLTGFFSRQDTKTPVKYGLIAVIFNIIMNTVVVFYYLKNPFDGAHAFLALATSLSAWIQVILLYLHLNKDGLIHRSDIFNKEPFISVISCIIMFLVLGSVLINPIALTENLYYIRGLLLIIYIILGALVYIALMHIFGYKFKKSYI